MHSIETPGWPAAAWTSCGQASFVFFIPGLEPEADQLACLNQSFPLKQELSHYRTRSDRLDIEARFVYRLASAVPQRLKRLTQPTH
jgi:hypothetical protein